MIRFSAFVLALSLSVSSFAAVEPTVGSLETTAPAPFSKINVDLFGWSYSNSFSQWDGLRASADGSSRGPVEIISQWQIHTPLFGSMDLVVMPQVKLQPTMGVLFQAQDVTAGIQGSVASSGGFSYWARYELAFPLSQGSAKDGLITAPQSVNSVAYQFPGTKVKLEGVLVPSLKFFNNGEQSFFLYASPRLYYLASDSFWVMSILETSWEAARGKALSTFSRLDPPTLGIGVRYTTLNGRGMYVQPFFNVYPWGTDVANSAHLGVMFGGPIL